MLRPRVRRTRWVVSFDRFGGMWGFMVGEEEKTENGGRYKYILRWVKRIRRRRGSVRGGDVETVYSTVVGDGRRVRR